MQDKIIKDMLANISDPSLQSMYGSILAGDIIARVHCLSDTCNGTVIATIDKLNVVSETAPIEKDGVYISGLEGSRKRFDGQIGFRCYCGNESILCDEERSIITPARPTKDDLTLIANRLSGRKGDPYQKINGTIVVDMFAIEDVK